MSIKKVLQKHDKNSCFSIFFFKFRIFIFFKCLHRKLFRKQKEIEEDKVSKLTYFEHPFLSIHFICIQVKFTLSGSNVYKIRFFFINLYHGNCVAIDCVHLKTSYDLCVSTAHFLRILK